MWYDEYNQYRPLIHANTAYQLQNAALNSSNQPSASSSGMWSDPSSRISHHTSQSFADSSGLFNRALYTRLDQLPHSQNEAVQLANPWGIQQHDHHQQRRDVINRSATLQAPELANAEVCSHLSRDLPSLPSLPSLSSLSSPSLSSPSLSSLPSHSEAVKFVNPWDAQQQRELPQQPPNTLPPLLRREDLPIPRTEIVLPTELRQNSRRTSAASRPGRPPALVRQGDRKLTFVDGLVDFATQIVESIWPTSSVRCGTDFFSDGILPLRTFIQETLRRSRTSFSTLQVALYYLLVIKPHVPPCDFTMEQPDDSATTRALQCGRRMFLTALILASKYLQDRNFSARAWSKISGLDTDEINENEMAFVEAVDWKLHVTDEVYNRWTDLVMPCTPGQPPSPSAASPVSGASDDDDDDDSEAQENLSDFRVRAFNIHCDAFQHFIRLLNPGLGNLEEVLPPWWRPGAHISPVPPVMGPPPIPSHSWPPVSRTSTTRPVIEPTPAPACAPRMVPALGLLPSRKRSSSHDSGSNTPAVSVASFTLERPSAMSFAMAQASTSACGSQIMERPNVPILPSPRNYSVVRQSSFNTTISSSPDSTAPDSERASRASSVSSASCSVVVAPLVESDFQARCHDAKPSGERLPLKPIFAPDPKDHAARSMMKAGLYSNMGSVGRSPSTLTAKDTPFMQRMAIQHDHTRESINDASRAFQALQGYRSGTYATPSAHANSGRVSATAPAILPAALETPVVYRKPAKRSRPVSMENSLQDNVREMLAQGGGNGTPVWPDTLVRSQPVIGTPGASRQIPLCANREGGRKRVCCSEEVVRV